MKTLQANLSSSIRIFHLHNGKMEIEDTIEGWIVELDRDEVEKLRKYFRDIDSKNDYEYRLEPPHYTPFKL